MVARLKTCLVTYPLEPPVLLDRLRTIFDTVHFYPGLAGNDYSAEQPALPSAEVLAESEVLLTFRLPANLVSIAQVPKLRLLQTVGSGTAQVTESAFWQTIKAEDDLTLCNCAGIHAPSISEHVLMTVMMLNHKQELAQAAARHEKRWASPQELGGLFIQEIRAQTVGIIGYGAIGREIGRLSAAFGARVLACTREGAPKRLAGFELPGTGDREGVIPSKYYKMDKASLHEFLGECDVVVNMLPSSVATRQFIDVAELTAMKDTAIYVNVGRGDTISTDALVSALTSDAPSTGKPGTFKIGAATLDVAEPEPLPDGHILFSLANVILTPHCSWASKVNFHRAVDVCELNVKRLANGEGALNALRVKGQ